MLSRNLVKKTFFCSFILLMLLTAALLPVVGYANSNKPLSVSVVITSLYDDSVKTVAPDSLRVKAVAPQITLNKHVAGFVNSYLEKADEFLQKMKSKSGRYFPAIERIFDQYGIPHQLKYLPIVESELHSKALSKVGARGMWQLMSMTGRELGLKISGKTDERTHTYRSTVAAAKYLRYLHTLFDDWLLVLAAYNGGPGKVYSAIKKLLNKFM